MDTCNNSNLEPENEMFPLSFHEGIAYKCLMNNNLLNRAYNESGVYNPRIDNMFGIEKINRNLFIIFLTQALNNGNVTDELIQETHTLLNTPKHQKTKLLIDFNQKIIRYVNQKSGDRYSVSFKNRKSLHIHKTNTILHNNVVAINQLNMSIVTINNNKVELSDDVKSSLIKEYNDIVNRIHDVDKRLKEELGTLDVEQSQDQEYLSMLFGLKKILPLIFKTK